MPTSQKSKQIEFPRGSEWRRWDLQVHTPLSALNNGFGKDFDAYAKVLFERAMSEEIAVIGVTDYFTIDGYKELRTLQQDKSRLTDLLGAAQAARAQQIRLLANVEFRLDDVVRVGTKDSRINAHVVFPTRSIPARSRKISSIDSYSSLSPNRPTGTQRDP